MEVEWFLKSTMFFSFINPAIAINLSGKIISPVLYCFFVPLEKINYICFFLSDCGIFVVATWKKNDISKDLVSTLTIVVSGEPIVAFALSCNLVEKKCKAGEICCKERLKHQTMPHCQWDMILIIILCETPLKV